MINIVKSPEGEELFTQTVPDLVNTMQKVKDSAKKLAEITNSIVGNLRLVRAEMDELNANRDNTQQVKK